ncbi:MAG: beta-phosphoglucomutase family hydrolase [Bacteroidales bacterium]
MNLNFKAVIFDLDGVITRTALVHSAAWKRMFDEFLDEWNKTHSGTQPAFDHERDYLPYVDGKPRYDGVASFLKSRGIDLPWGNPSDSPGEMTVCGLGNRKNEMFNKVLEQDGVELFETTVNLIRELKSSGIKVGVASSSKNCLPVLERAEIADLFETRVDGVVSAELGLSGKPAPDIFTTAAANLGVKPAEGVVVEDAVSGVMAGKEGNFGLVIGIAREENSSELLINGADIVVTDLGEISLKDIDNWFVNGLKEDNWSLTYHDFDSGKERTRETLLTTGNGYFGTRGAFEESKASTAHYPGTYMAGLYNRLVSRVGDRDVENEDFVNLPNWIPFTFRPDGEEWFETESWRIEKISRRLDFRKGELVRNMIVVSPAGNRFEVVSSRFVSMNDRHVASQSYSVIPLGEKSKITFRAFIDGNICNAGVERYRSLNQQHLQPVTEGAENDHYWLEAVTTQSGIKISIAARIRSSNGIQVDFRPVVKPGEAGLEWDVEAEAGNAASFEKIVSIYSDQSWDSDTPLEMARSHQALEKTYQELLDDSVKSWKTIWDEIDLQVKGDRLAQKLFRLHNFHLMASFSPHNKDIDASVTARGLHGEAYRGHIFWDELFILPYYNLHFPEVSKAALLYRYRRLDAAYRYAREYGYEGAMYPWQSGSDGREETQVLHLNPVSGEWGPDYSSLQRHVSLAIAWNVITYAHMTGDVQFLEDYGLEMLVGISRFWAGKADWSDENQRYSISGVMGPDEFHEKYPGSSEGGLRDNAYTNVMVAWLLRETANLGRNAAKELRNKLNLSDEEIEKWEDIRRKLRLVIDDGIIAQYDGYFDLEELDWDYYRKKYGNIYRMDRILKAEGKSPDRYKVAKQADTLQLFYNLDGETVSGLIREMGYELPDDFIRKNLEYYLARTSHGSTLSRVVHAWLATMVGDEQLSTSLYRDALTSDYRDIQGGTTGEGIHAGVMAGTLWIPVHAWAGASFEGEKVRFNPRLPAEWDWLGFNFHFKKIKYACNVTHHELSLRSMAETPVEVEVRGSKITLNPGNETQIELS